MQITFDSVSGKFVATDVAGNVLDSSKNRDYLKRKLGQIGIKATSAAQTVTNAAAAEFATNLGTEFTPEEREQAQQVVLGAVIVTQLSTATRRIK